jgi:hypothetical protein
MALAPSPLVQTNPMTGYAFHNHTHSAAPKALQQSHSAAKHASKCNILTKHKSPARQTQLLVARSLHWSPLDAIAAELV